jgi:hypothetical protein
MGFAPDWRQYGDVGRVKASYEAEDSCGGPVTQDLHVKEEDRWLYTPLATEFWEVLDRVAAAAYEGAEVGGYVRIMGLQMNDGTDGERVTYADVSLYCTAGEQGYSFLKALNGTDQRDALDAVTWEDIKRDLTGLGRIVKYGEKVNPYA